MKIILFTFALAAGLLVSGCKSGGAYTPKNTAKYAVEKDSKFVLLDPGAQRSVTSTGLQEGRTPDGRLQVAVNLRNRENRRIEVQINCEFKDEQGFTVDRVPFETIILTENAQETKQFTSTTPLAKTYTIRVRQSR